MPDHLWFIRRIEVDVQQPFLSDHIVDVTTWCSGVGAIAAGRRWSLTGDDGGTVEVESVWIHLGPDARPARLEDFGIYAEATAGRHVSTRIELPDVPAHATTSEWPLRSTDVDRHAHVNNAVHWEAVEHRLAAGGADVRRPLQARLDYGDPLSLGERVQLAEWRDGETLSLAFVVDGATKAFAVVA